MCMVDLSKALMYEFHYDYIKNKYGNKSRKLFKDTGSLLYEIETENVYDNFCYNKKMFGFTIYYAKSKHYYYSNALFLVK